MKKIIRHLKDYILHLDPRITIALAIYSGLLVCLNYAFDVNGYIRKLPFIREYLCWYLVFFCSFVLPYFVILANHRLKISDNRFWLLLAAAPAIFAWKMSVNMHFTFSTDGDHNAYWNAIAYWPIKLAVVTLAIFTLAEPSERKCLFGLQHKGISMQPYFMMLIVMVPLIAAASFQADFLSMYPKFQKLQLLQSDKNPIRFFLFELSYGSDFVGIEMFFRGFLILSFAKYVGKAAILPMAVFYCTIHFGKPLGECVSSFFGGIVLGVITFHTRSIWGGLVVHLGIAWLMEIGGYFGNLYFRHSE